MLIKNKKVFCLITVSLLFALSGCQKKNKMPETLIRTVKIMQVEKVATEQVRRIAGVVEAEKVAELSFRVPGTIAVMKVDLGDQVKKGEFLAKLDPLQYELNVHAAKAELAKAKATMLSKEEHYKAKSRLVKNSVVSQYEANTAKADYEASFNTVKVAEAKLDLAQRDLDETILTAPFAGVIAEREVNAHTEVNKGQLIYQLQSNDDFIVRLRLPDTLIYDVKVNDNVEIAIPSIKHLIIKGKVYRIGAISSGAHAYPLEIKILDDNKLLRSGMAAEVVFHFKYENKKPAIIIPYYAILPSDKKMQGYVFLYDPKTHTVKKTNVVARDIINNEVEIEQGLKPGDFIVVAGVHYLHDGEKVKLMRDENHDNN